MTMRNFDNTLRFYNRAVLKKTKMHTYTKKYIDNLMEKCMFGTFEVPLTKLTVEDIANYKLSLIKNEDNISKEKGIDDISIDYEPAGKKHKLDTNGIDFFKSVLSRESETHTFESQFNSSLISVKEIASTGIEKVPTVINCDESTKSTNSSTKNVRSMINVINVRKMMEEDKYIRWMKCLYSDINLTEHNITNGNTNLAVAQPSTSKFNNSLYSTKVNEVKYPLNAENHVKGNLIEIEKLYKKYFGKSVLDTIIAIANILNIISISNKHHKERMDDTFKKISEAEKFKERCTANHFHGVHKIILETKLKTNFIYVISSFAESEFDMVFQMFFLSILTVFRVLNQPKFRTSRIFSNLILLLSTSLKSSSYNHPKMLSMFQSKTFRPDCIKLISLIEDSRDTDPEIIHRMPLFFISIVESQRYFQAAINAVTGKFNENLELLIDNATSQCSINSPFKDAVDSSMVEHLNWKLPVTETIQSPINSGITTQTTFRFKNKNGTCQITPVLNYGNKSQTIGNAGIEPSIVTSQQLNNFHDPFSSSLQKKTSTSSNSTMISKKKYTVVRPIISNSSLHQAASSAESVTSTPSKRKFLTLNTSIEDIKTEKKSSLPIIEGKSILIGKTSYKIVSMPPNKMKAVVFGTNLLEKKPSTELIECFKKNCKKSAKIMCSKCKIVKYCSINCQKQHWYTEHLTKCDDLLRQHQTLP